MQILLTLFCILYMGLLVSLGYNTGLCRHYMKRHGEKLGSFVLGAISLCCFFMAVKLFVILLLGPTTITFIDYLNFVILFFSVITYRTAAKKLKQELKS